MKARSPVKMMDVCDEKVTDEVGFSVQQHDDQSIEHPLEGTYLDQSRGQRVCVSASHPDTDALLHDGSVIALREEPSLHLTSTC